jgi:transcriptional regulator with XRE-family HTH domain
MEKSLFSREYAIFLALLRRARQDAGLTQEQLAERLDETQSWVSKCERGERRLDLVEARAFCAAFGTPFAEFVRDLEEAIAGEMRGT